MSHARMKTVFLQFSIYLPWSIFLIAVAVEKPGFRGISTCLVSSKSAIKVKAKEITINNITIYYFKNKIIR